MKPKVYIETTVVSYLTARRSRDLIVAAHQEITQEWWQRRLGEFELYCSQLVIQEGGPASSPGSPTFFYSRDQRRRERVGAARSKGSGHPEKGHRGCASYRLGNGSWYGLSAYLELQTYSQCGDTKVGNANLSSAGLRTAGDLHARRIDGGLIKCGKIRLLKKSEKFVRNTRPNSATTWTQFVATSKSRSKKMQAE